MFVAREIIRGRRSAQAASRWIERVEQRPDQSLDDSGEQALAEDRHAYLDAMKRARLPEKHASRRMSRPRLRQLR